MSSGLAVTARSHKPANLTMQDSERLYKVAATAFGVQRDFCTICWGKENQTE